MTIDAPRFVTIPSEVSTALQPLEGIVAERLKQFQKWGDQDLTDLHWFAVLSEEFGESAKEVVEIEACRKGLETAKLADAEYLQKELERRSGMLETELIQTAAVIVAWLEARARRLRKAEEKT